ncbi:MULTISPECIES: ATP-binding cassette domain-containing protein [unclassified Microbacterium]|uniref:ATP-binding cassette domain-containing protein n=1 Tax=unclassified Microbacterium TaxID=2609290 RepID=UPI00214AFB47|nr:MULTISPECIES: ATP-binding cassette domain-containing protein [unclassified Microbacterium]MCR2785188.1 ATP-binding cassette domain-containing protein [Microbacterium sp. zg.B96]WIM16721.1 ATP-binding cassette domain-containing protein [Microbacterium sp. zg-B96]
MPDVLLRAEALTKTFQVRNAWGRRLADVRALDGVDLEIRRGETLAVVGESGSGKSTLGRCLLQMQQPSSGTIRYEDTDLTALSRRQRLPFHRFMQVVFQDPFTSLNPHRTALQNVAEPIRVLTPDRDADAAAREALKEVGITGDDVHKRPRAFSGGQRQRIGIARAIGVRPEFIVCDEPVSALDVSIQAQVTALLARLQRDHDLTYLFISHDLGVVREIATRTAVMRAGRILEIGPTASVFDSPQHPYTRTLLDAALVADPAVARRRLARVAADGHEADPESEGALVEQTSGHFVRR